VTSQRQQGGDRSVNLQGEVVFYQGGVSYADAKSIAQDVFRANALALAGVAQQAAAARVEELTEKFLGKLSESPDNPFDALEDPDVQHSLYTAQVGYARSGSLPLSETLVALLVDRCSTQSQGIEALVLNEAIATLPKITTGQANLLTLSWILRQASTPLNSIEAHGRFLEEYIGPLLGDLPTSKVDIGHLQYAGCLTMGATETDFDFVDVVTSHFGHLYDRGFPLTAVPLPLQKHLTDERLFRDFDHQGTLYRTTSGSERASSGLSDLAFMGNAFGQFRDLSRQHRMTSVRIMEALEPHFDRIGDLQGIWEKSLIRATAPPRQMNTPARATERCRHQRG
jgi:hypothetical protein